MKIGVSFVVPVQGSSIGSRNQTPTPNRAGGIRRITEPDYEGTLNYTRSDLARLSTQSVEYRSELQFLELAHRNYSSHNDTNVLNFA